MQDLWEPVFVPVHQEAVGTVTAEEQLVQSEPYKGQWTEENPRVSTSSSSAHSGHQHPLGLLMKEHTQEKSQEGISFPTITDFKRFVETMKSSFLTPGSDLTHFHTALQTMENEMSSAAKNTEGASSPDHQAYYGVESPGENEVWSEPVTSVFEQGQLGSNHHVPGTSLSAPDQLDMNPSFPGVYDVEESRIQLYDTEPVSGGFDSLFTAGMSGRHSEPLPGPPDVLQEDVVQAGKYKFPQTDVLSSSSYSDVSPPISPSQDSNERSSLVSEQPQQPSHSNDSPSSNSYGKSFYVWAQSLPAASWFTVQNKQLKRREGAASPAEPVVSTESEDPTRHVNQPEVSSGSQSHSGHVDIQASDPHDGEFVRKDGRAHLFPVTPSNRPGDSYHQVHQPNLMTRPSRGLGSTWHGISSQGTDGSPSLSSPTNTSPASESAHVFGHFVGNGVPTKNIISARIPAGLRDVNTRNPSRVFSTPGVFFNGHYASAVSDDLQTLVRPFKDRKRLTSVHQMSPSNMALRHRKQSADTFSRPWRNSRYRNWPRLHTAPLYVVKSKTGYVRTKLFLSKSRYTPSHR